MFVCVDDIRIDNCIITPISDFQHIICLLIRWLAAKMLKLGEWGIGIDTLHEKMMGIFNDSTKYLMRNL